MTEKEIEIFAKRLKELRIVEGLTQEKLAKKLNISRSCLANYESCKRKPNEDIVSSIANYFGVNEGYLTGNKLTFFPIGDDKEFDVDLSDVLSSDGQLDISGISPTAKIALIEFYNYLMSRVQNEHDEPDQTKKTENF